MRYEKGHKDLTRQHILDVASEQFRTHGVAAAGVAGIMSGGGADQRGLLRSLQIEGGSRSGRAWRCVEQARADAPRRGRRRQGAGRPDPRLPVAAPSRRSRPWLSDGGDGGGDRAPSEENPRCLHRQDQRLRRTDRRADRRGLARRAAQDGDRGLRRDDRHAAIGARRQRQATSDEILESGVTAALALAGSA